MNQDMLGFNIIFERKDSSIREKDDANLYQDIMKYCIFVIKNGNDGSFDYWDDLGNWLLDNNKEYVNRYKIAKNREGPLENIQKRVKRKLNNLEKLGLIQNIGTRKQTKGSGDVTVYKYTDFGRLLAWIIQSFDPAMSEEANPKVYEIIETILKIDKDSPSLDIFFSDFIGKCKGKGVFGDIVYLFRKILSSDIPIKTIQDLFSYTMNLDFEDQKRMDYFNDLWAKTMQELDPAVKQLVLYHLKLGIEEKMEKQAKVSKGFEKMRYDVRGSPELIALEAVCSICQLYYPIGVNLMEYRDKILHAKGDPITLSTIRCKKCNLDGSIVMPQVI